MFLVKILIFVIAILPTCSSVAMENLNINDNTGAATLSPEEKLELCLVGTLLTDKPVKFKAMQECLANIWRPSQKVEIAAIAGNRFLFQFFHLWDMERVFQAGPWTFDNHMLVLKKLAVGDEPLAVKLDEIEVWVQIFNLPFGYVVEPIGLLIGSHLGRYVKYDDYTNSGSWRLYMRVRVAIKVDEPLKQGLTFEKEDGGVVHVFFKYERLGIFCFLCGVLGHTESFCPKRVEPGFVEGEKEWGNFLRSNSSSIGGGSTINKWLYDSRGQSRGSHSGGNKATNGTTNGNAMRETEAVGINVGQPVQHARFGRVKVIRDVQGRGFIFQTATANPMHRVAAYDGTVQWVPFVINLESLANPLVNSAVGQRIILERSNNTNALQAATGNIINNSAMMVRTLTNGSAAEELPIGLKPSSAMTVIPIADVTQTPSANSMAQGSGIKIVSAPKKRMRTSQAGKDAEAEADELTKEMTADTTHVKASTSSLKKTGLGAVNMRSAENDTAVHTNPLFDVDIVMAGTGSQACQPK
ncbi:hypothetical protein L195_g012392 [Trifolium pratense]|uniref:CCHC-type domain-containing protein n=1 Tax=Trifolium pratense TaxID=57577 RepID=A0A2K3PK71_TRIPR|nr:hypothetical protein L195_g012392 [Trifolium pratense]